MTFKTILLAVTLTLTGSAAQAAEDYKTSEEYQTLRETMRHAFNDGDSARFFPALKNLENYLLKQNDLHGYYTQRCNEIVFLMNRQRIIEAYKLARQLSQELREKDLESERYMALNMLGHINRYCGNEKEAKKNWFEVLRLMEEHQYYSSMPPIYMNIVNVAIDDSPEEADSLLLVAKGIAQKHDPERVFDIETRQTLSYFNRGDTQRFLEGYKKYKEGVKEGKSSVHGRSMEVYYLTLQGKVDEAVKMAREELGDDGLDAIPIIYERTGRWKEAYQALKAEYTASDSIDNVVLMNSMQGIRDEIRLYDSERETYRTRVIGLTAAILLLTLLILALVYIVYSRRKHLKEMQKAYRRAMESEQMKAAITRNISHEIRTPLNIISGFAQVIANPELAPTQEERAHMADMIQENAHRMTNLIDEIIGLSLIESTEKMKREDQPRINELLREQIAICREQVKSGVKVSLETTLGDDFTLVTNANMLKRIVGALLENAAKYTTEGHITLRAEKESDRLLSLCVEDTGCGIPKEDAERIFERFVKLDSFQHGIGLGLPLSRKLAEQLDGTIYLDTDYNSGARFYVKLPI